MERDAELLRMKIRPVPDAIAKSKHPLAHQYLEERQHKVAQIVQLQQYYAQTHLLKGQAAALRVRIRQEQQVKDDNEKIAYHRKQVAELRQIARESVEETQRQKEAEAQIQDQSALNHARSIMPDLPATPPGPIGKLQGIIRSKVAPQQQEEQSQHAARGMHPPEEGPSRMAPPAMLVQEHLPNAGSKVSNMLEGAKAAISGGGSSAPSTSLHHPEGQSQSSRGVITDDHDHGDIDNQQQHADRPGPLGLKDKLAAKLPPAPSFLPFGRAAPDHQRAAEDGWVADNKQDEDPWADTNDDDFEPWTATLRGVRTGAGDKITDFQGKVAAAVFGSHPDAQDTGAPPVPMQQQDAGGRSHVEEEDDEADGGGVGAFLGDKLMRLRQASTRSMSDPDVTYAQTGVFKSGNHNPDDQQPGHRGNDNPLEGEEGDGSEGSVVVRAQKDEAGAYDSNLSPPSPSSSLVPHAMSQFVDLKDKIRGAATGSRDPHAEGQGAGSGPAGAVLDLWGQVSQAVSGQDQAPDDAAVWTPVGTSPVAPSLVERVKASAPAGPPPVVTSAMDRFGGGRPGEVEEEVVRTPGLLSRPEAPQQISGSAAAAKEQIQGKLGQMPSIFSPAPGMMPPTTPPASTRQPETPATSLGFETVTPVRSTVPQANAAATPSGSQILQHLSASNPRLLRELQEQNPEIVAQLGLDPAIAMYIPQSQQPLPQLAAKNPQLLLKLQMENPEVVSHLTTSAVTPQQPAVAHTPSAPLIAQVKPPTPVSHLQTTSPSQPTHELHHRASKTPSPSASVVSHQAAAGGWSQPTTAPAVAPKGAFVLDPHALGQRQESAGNLSRYDSLAASIEAHKPGQPHQLPAHGQMPTAAGQGAKEAAPLPDNEDIDMDDLEDYPGRIKNMYVVYAPDKLERVAEHMDRFKGREKQLLGALIQKYGPEPDHQTVEAITQNPPMYQGGDGGGTQASSIPFSHPLHGTREHMAKVGKASPPAHSRSNSMEFDSRADEEPPSAVAVSEAIPDAVRGMRAVGQIIAKISPTHSPTTSHVHPTFSQSYDNGTLPPLGPSSQSRSRASSVSSVVGDVLAVVVKAATPPNERHYYQEEPPAQDYPPPQWGKKSPPSGTNSATYSRANSVSPQAGMLQRTDSSAFAAVGGVVGRAISAFSPRNSPVSTPHPEEVDPQDDLQAQSSGHQRTGSGQVGKSPAKTPEASLCLAPATLDPETDAVELPMPMMTLDEAQRKSSLFDVVLRLRREPGFLRSWKQRIIAIVGHRMVMFREGAKEVDECVEQVCLVDSRGELPTEKVHGRKFAILLHVTSCAQPYTLAFPTKDEQTKWVRSIRNAQKFGLAMKVKIHRERQLKSAMVGGITPFGSAPPAAVGPAGSAQSFPSSGAVAAAASAPVVVPAPPQGSTKDEKDAFYRDVLFQLYTYYEPHKVPSFDKVIAVFKGREADVIKVLLKKYGSMPPPWGQRVHQMSERHCPQNTAKLDAVVKTTSDTSIYGRLLAPLVNEYGPEWDPKQK